MLLKREVTCMNGLFVVSTYYLGQAFLYLGGHQKGVDLIENDGLDLLLRAGLSQFLV